MANELKKAEPQFSVMLSDKLDSVENALPSGFNKARFVQNALALLNDNPALQKYSKTQLLAGLMKASVLGLDAYNKECYLIPYDNQLQFQIDYRGAKKLAKKYSIRPIKDIDAKVVREGDRFEEVVEGGESSFIFKPKPFNTGKIVGAFAYVLYEDGGMMVDSMSLDELENTRRHSKASNSMAWKDFTGEMYKKGLSIDTPILTPTGFVPMKDIEVGDTVFDMDGQKVTVTDVSEIKRIKCFEVIFSDGERIVCDNEHRWIARIGSHAYKKPWETYTVNQLQEAKAAGMGVSIPVCKPVDFDEKELIVPPYVLGYWLGNGSRRHANVTCDASDSEEICELITTHSNGKYQIGAKRTRSGTNATSIGVSGGLITDLKKLGVYMNKHIPVDYMTASYSQRLDLIRGLMDSDGTMTMDRGEAIFSTVNSELASDVYQIVSSLGEKAYTNAKICKGFMKEVVGYSVCWRPSVCPVYLKRKADRFVPRKLCIYRSIKEINEIETVPTKCIAVDSPTKSYLAGYGCIPTHNTVLHRLCKHIEIQFETPEQYKLYEDDVAIATSPKEQAEMDIASGENQAELIVEEPTSEA